MKIRGLDCHGSGAWQAPRGHRKHNGVDVVCQPGDKVRSLTDGKVTKYGYPYNPSSEKGYLRYVEVTDANRARIRYFYVERNFDIVIGKTVTRGDILGKAQNIEEIYSGITQHYHLEIIAYTNPLEYLGIETE